MGVHCEVVLIQQIKHLLPLLRWCFAPFCFLFVCFDVCVDLKSMSNSVIWENHEYMQLTACIAVIYFVAHAILYLVDVVHRLFHPFIISISCCEVHSVVCAWHFLEAFIIIIIIILLCRWWCVHCCVSPTALDVKVICTLLLFSFFLSFFLPSLFKITLI